MYENDGLWYQSKQIYEYIYLIMVYVKRYIMNNNDNMLEHQNSKSVYLHTSSLGRYKWRYIISKLVYKVLNSQKHNYLQSREGKV